MNVENTKELARELGLKLRNFRHKLAFAIGQKKITTAVFGEMFGGHSDRKIQTYETGDVIPPATLLFFLWKNGNSIDDIFSEGPIAERGREEAKKLYDRSIVASIADADENQREKLLAMIEEKTDEKAPPYDRGNGSVAVGSRSRKTGLGTQSKTKKRDGKTGSRR